MLMVQVTRKKYHYQSNRTNSWMLDDLHETHQEGQIKGRARTVVWWPGLDKSIEEMMINCSACQAS